jgi:AAA family ATP:ADP antiporter
MEEKIEQNPFLNKIKDYIWPIEKSELKVFIPMSLLLLSLLFNFGMLRSIKDSIIVPELGAEVISFIKLWCVLPAAVLFTIIYFKLSNIFEIDKLFIIIIVFFLSVILIFGFILFPNQDSLHLKKDTIDLIASNYPNLYWYIKIIGKWSYTVIYVISELWGVIAIQLVYWQFANHFFKTEQAKRLYPILNLMGNFGLIAAGFILISSSNLSWIDIFYKFGILQESTLNAQNSIKLLTIFVVIAGIFSIIFFKISLKNLTSYPMKVDKLISTKKSKTKLSLKESIILVISSRYICYLVLMIMSYGIAVTLIEGPWKAKIVQRYPTTNEYLNFIGSFNIALGVFGIFGAIFVSNLVRRASWRTAAVSVPLIIGVTGVILFIFIIVSDIYDNKTIYGMSFLSLAIIIGSIQNILSKSTKYSLFDSTKELAYIPLSLELRTKGKAAADIIGAKFGKSLSAILQSVAFTLIPGSSFESFYISLGIIFVVVIIVWIYSVYKLSIEYKKITGE